MVKVVLKSHQQILKDIHLGAQIHDRRIKHMPAAVRWFLSRATSRHSYFYGSYAVAASGLDFRPDCGSGRHGHWHRATWMGMAAMIADLIRLGYSANDARRIARAAATSERVVWGVQDSPPAVPAEELAATESYGWADHEAAKLGVSRAHILAWTAWRRRKRPAAQVGRRTRQFFAACDRIRAAQQAARRQNRIRNMTAAAASLADRLRPILGADQEGIGWLARTGAIETSHSFAEQHPGWAEEIVAVGVRVMGRGCLGLSSCVDPVEVIEAARS